MPPHPSKKITRTPGIHVCTILECTREVCVDVCLLSLRGVALPWPVQGSKTNHFVGAFAGITDVQGSDAYCAACAPTMLGVAYKLSMRYPYDYLNNARENHKPLPMWGYSQLYSDAWSYQANYEALVAQVILYR